jgi:hypothetical protein
MLNYQTVDFMAGQLADQYAAQKQLGLAYPNEEDLPVIFRAQAAKLAANGIASIYDVGVREGDPYTVTETESDGTDGVVEVERQVTPKFLINKQTGEPIKKIGLKSDWETNPEAINVGKDIQLQDRGSFDRWGFDTSVEGMAHYGIAVENGVPVFTPYYKDTSSKIFGMKLEDVAKLLLRLLRFTLVALTY